MREGNEGRQPEKLYVDSEQPEYDEWSDVTGVRYQVQVDLMQYYVIIVEYRLYSTKPSLNGNAYKPLQVESVHQAMGVDIFNQS